MSRVQPGDVLVSDMTDPDWEPVMKRAVRHRHQPRRRTCHAAIIARELGIPAVVGCGNATDRDQRRPARHGVLRRRRHRRRLRRPAGLRAAADRAGRAAEAARADHDECRQPGSRLRLRVDPESRCRPCAPRVHHQPHDRRAPARAAGIRDARAGRAGAGPPADGRLRRPGRVLRRKAGRGHRQHRRGVRAAAGDRAPVGLQVE